MTNELAASLVAVAWNYRRSARSLPPRVIADLHDVANTDTIANRLRSDARRLLSVEDPLWSPGGV